MISSPAPAEFMITVNLETRQSINFTVSNMPSQLDIGEANGSVSSVGQNFFDLYFHPSTAHANKNIDLVLLSMTSSEGILSYRELSGAVQCTDLFPAESTRQSLLLACRVAMMNQTSLFLGTIDLASANFSGSVTSNIEQTKAGVVTVEEEISCPAASFGTIPVTRSIRRSAVTDFDITRLQFLSKLTFEGERLYVDPAVSLQGDYLREVYIVATASALIVPDDGLAIRYTLIDGELKPSTSEESRSEYDIEFYRIVGEVRLHVTKTAMLAAFEKLSVPDGNQLNVAICQSTIFEVGSGGSFDFRVVRNSTLSPFKSHPADQSIFILQILQVMRNISLAQLDCIENVILVFSVKKKTNNAADTLMILGLIIIILVSLLCIMYTANYAYRNGLKKAVSDSYSSFKDFLSYIRDCTNRSSNRDYINYHIIQDNA